MCVPYRELRNYPDFTLAWLAMAFKGVTSKDKLKLFYCAVLESVPSMVSKRLPNQLNATMEHVADRLVLDVVVKVGGNKYVLVDAESLRVVSPFFEVWMQSNLKVKQGETFLDIGAHVGKYSFQIAREVERSLVICIEAHPDNFRALKRGIELNGFRNVIAINVAAWKENCKIKLYIGKNSGWHSLKTNGNSEYVIVQGARLDEVLKCLNVQRLNWIKIDVEGAELEVLQGLKQNLQRQPHLIMEVRALTEVTAFLKQFGYIGRNLSSINFLFTNPQKPPQSEA